MSDQEDGARLAWFLAGAALGAAGALLMAPKPGKETRQQIRRRAEETREQMLQRGREAMELGRELYERGRQIAEEAASQGKEVLEKGREKLKPLVAKGSSDGETARSSEEVETSAPAGAPETA